MISALDRKLVRDLSQMKGQAVAIALVISAGVATFVNSRTILHSLELTRATFYEHYRFADAFAHVKRVPDAVIEQLREIPGVAAVETRVVRNVNLDVPGLDEPAVGQLISLPVTRQPTLNQLYLRRGRQLELGHDDEVLASEAFLKANQLDVGDSIVAIINGRRKLLHVVGVAFSPEYVFQIKPGDMLPDPQHFGILWMEHEVLANAFDMDGAFNDVAFGLQKGASLDEVIHRADLILEPYGCLGSFGRKDQLSHLLLEGDIQGLRTRGLIAPTIFLCVAAFLLNVVLTRLTSLQREQIAALKAFGYSNLQIAWHYMKFVLLITMIGGAIGTLGGMGLAQRVYKDVHEGVPVSGAGIPSPAECGGHGDAGGRQRGDSRRAGGDSHRRAAAAGRSDAAGAAGPLQADVVGADRRRLAAAQRGPHGATATGAAPHQDGFFNGGDRDVGRDRRCGQLHAGFNRRSDSLSVLRRAAVRLAGGDGRASFVRRR